MKSKNILFCFILSFTLFFNSFVLAEENVPQSQSSLEIIQKVKLAGDTLNTALQASLNGQVLNNQILLDVIDELYPEIISGKSAVSSVGDMMLAHDHLDTLRNSATNGIADFTESLDLLDKYGGTVLDIAGAGLTTYSFGQNVAKIVNDDGDLIENYAFAAQDLMGLYQASLNITKVLPSSVWAKKWATTNFAKAVGSTTVKAVSGLLLFVQAEAEFYAYLRDQQLDTTKFSIMSIHSTHLQRRTLIIEELFKKHIEALKNNEVLSLLNIGNVLDHYVVVNPLSSDGGGLLQSGTTLWNIFNEYRLSEFYLNEHFGKSTFEELNSFERVEVVLQALTEMSIKENVDLIAYMAETITSDSWNDILVGAFNGSDAYAIFNTDDLKKQIDITYGTSYSAMEYLNKQYQIIYNSLLANEGYGLLENIGFQLERSRINDASFTAPNATVTVKSYNDGTSSFMGVFDESNNYLYPFSQKNIYNDNVMLTDGTLDLNGSIVIINGNFTQTGGDIKINGGTLIVKGNYHITSEDGTSYSLGLLYMTNENDYVRVDGNFVMDSKYGGSTTTSSKSSTYSYKHYTYYNKSVLTEGTLEVKGNFTQRSSSTENAYRYYYYGGGSYGGSSTSKYYVYFSKHNFNSSGNHKVLLSGAQKQTVNFSAPGINYGIAKTNTNSNANNSHFNILEIINSSSEGVELASQTIVAKELKATQTPIINPDNMSLSGNAISSQDNWNYDLRLNSLLGTWTLQQNQVIDKNFFAENSVFMNGYNLHVKENLSFSGTTLDINGSTLTIDGNLTQISGIIDLKGGTLIVNGNFTQTGGDIKINGGTLIVKGNYHITNEDGTSYSTGLLYMTNENDYVRVDGNFVMDSKYGGSITTSYKSVYNSYSKYYTYYNNSVLTEGTLEVKGNFTQRSSSTENSYRYYYYSHPYTGQSTSKYYVYFSKHNFNSSENHKVLLSGAQKQTVNFSAPGINYGIAKTNTNSNANNSHFNILEIINSSSEGVELASQVVVLDTLRQCKNSTSSDLTNATYAILEENVQCIPWNTFVDTNNNGIPDSIDLKYQLSQKQVVDGFVTINGTSISIEQLIADTYNDNDNDGYTNLEEIINGTNPDIFTESAIIAPPVIQESGNPDAIYKFSLTLNKTIPIDHYVAVNFDNQQGDWFTQADAGGHIVLDNVDNNNTYWLNRSLNKPGLRSFRAGIFDANDNLVGEYSDFTTCTLDRCLEEVTQFSDYGNPQLSRSGSQLFGGVDVANGNLHYATIDMSIQGKGPDFTLIRAYNSNSNSWSFNFDTAISFVADTYNRQISIEPREDGRVQSYYKDMDNKWYALSTGNFDKLVENTDGSFILYTQGNLFYNFAKPTDTLKGRLVSISDRDDNALTFSHTSNLISGATDASNNTYTITRDTNGNITKVTDFTQRYVQYTYNADDMIIAYKNPRELTTNYTFNSTKLSSIIDPKGNTLLRFTYFTTAENQNNVKSITSADNNIWEYNYTQTLTTIERPVTNGKNNNVVFKINNKRTKVIERIDAQSYGDYKTRMQYKTTQNRQRIAEFGLVTQTQKPSGDKTDISYYDDGTGNTASIIEPLSKTTGLNWSDEIVGQTNLTPLTSIYDSDIATPTIYKDFTSSGKAQEIVNRLGNSTFQTYTSGQLTQITDARSNNTNIIYDTQGRPIKITDALGGYVENNYDDLGRITSSKNARGYLSSYTYDENGNILTATDANNGVTTYTYDDSDNVVSIKDPRNTTMTYSYDTSNRKVSENYSVAGVAYTRRYQYDAMGRVHKVTNESSNTSETQFDERGQTIKVINPLLQSTTYTYDENGNVLTIKDAENRTITNEYDALDRKIKVTDSLGLYEAYTYNAQGLLATKQDKKGLITSYEYDDLGQMTKITDPQNNGITKATYDKNGNLSSSIDRKNQTVSYTYDKLNRMTQQTDAMGRNWEFTYDANGNVKTRTLPSNKVISYSYDKLDRVTQVVYHDGQTVTYTYDVNSNRITMQDDQGTTNYTYDELNRLTNVANSFGVSVGYVYHPTGTLKELIYPNNKKVIYIYDKVNRLSSLTDWLGDTTSYERDNTGLTKLINYSNGTKVETLYDEAGRLTSLINKKDTTIISSHILTLDKIGNPINIQADIPLLPINFGRDADMLYDSSNRLTKVNNLSITHDIDGRVTDDETHTDPIEYAYNAQDLITIMKTNNVISEEYSYDGDGHRIAKKTGGETTRYLYDITGGDVYSLLAETNSANQVQYYYIYAEGLISQISGTNHKYYHYDQSGNTLALTNNSGTVTDKYAYEPFGNTTVDGNSHNPFKFVGRYGVMDDGNGLHYMRARYYNANTKRFQSIDALGGQVTDPMTLNRYQYVSGNPLVGIDPSGYKKSTWQMLKEGFMDVYIGKVWNPKSEESVFSSMKIVAKDIPTISPKMNKALDEAIENTDDNFVKGVLYFAKGVKTVSDNYLLDRYAEIANKCINEIDNKLNNEYLISTREIKACIGSLKDLASPEFSIKTDYGTYGLDPEGTLSYDSGGELGKVSISNDGTTVSTKDDFFDIKSPLPIAD